MKSAFNIEIILTNIEKPGILVDDFRFIIDKITKTNFLWRLPQPVVKHNWTMKSFLMENSTILMDLTIRERFRDLILSE